MHPLFTLLLILSFTLSSVGQVVPGYAVYYSFSGNTNNTGSTMVNTTNNNVALGADRYNTPNSAGYFNGIGSFLSTDYMPQGISGFTISLWLKTGASQNNYPKTHSILDFRGNGNAKGLQIEYYEPSGAYTWGLGSSYLWDAQSFTYNNDSTWIHFVFVWDPGTNPYISNGQFRIYRNGTLQTTTANYYNPYSAAPTSTPFSATAGMKLGSLASSSFYAGAMDEVIIYERALSDSEIVVIYTGEPVDTTTGGGTTPTPPPTNAIATTMHTPSSLFCYPTTVTNLMNIELRAEQTAMEGELVIFDITGKVVMRREETLYKNRAAVLDLSNLSSGMYSLAFVSRIGGQQFIQKLIKL